MTRHCAHPACRTSLDEHPVECPHGRPFCEHCTWEDGCGDCNVAALIVLNARIWHEATDARPPKQEPGLEWAEHWAEQRRDEDTYYGRRGA